MKFIKNKDFFILHSMFYVVIVRTSTKNLKKSKHFDVNIVPLEKRRGLENGNINEYCDSLTSTQRCLH